MAAYLSSAFLRIKTPATFSYGLLPPEWEPKEVVEIWWGDPQTWGWSDEDVKLRVGICLSEARSILSSGRTVALSNISRCDLLICPTIHAAQAFWEAPIDIPIHIVPFGIDPDEFPYTDRDWNGQLRYLHLGRIQFRKGSWMVPDAFIRAFDNEDVLLTMACMGNETPMFQQLAQEYGQHPKLRFVSGYLDSAMEYYRNHHVLVSPHLAEGWGLCIPEALATGMTGLVARCSAPLEYFEKRFGWWIEMSEQYAPIRNCLQDTGGQWRLPDIDSLADVMKQAHDDRIRCEQTGMDASELFHNHYTWHDTVDKIMEVLS